MKEPLHKTNTLDDEDDEEDELTGKSNEAFASQDKPTAVTAYSETKETVFLLENIRHSVVKHLFT